MTGSCARLALLTRSFVVELPGIETEHLPGIMHSELVFRYVSFPFSPARYLRFRFRVLTASRAGTSCSSPPGAPGPQTGASTIRPNALEVVCVVGLANSQSGRDTEFLVDLRPVLAAPRGEENPIVNLVVSNYEAHRGPLGYGCLLEGKRRRFE